MDAADPPAITPAPRDDEAAAIIAALTAYLAEQRRIPAPPRRVTSPWALAGRLTSHGFAARRISGTRITWQNAHRRVE